MPSPRFSLRKVLKLAAFGILCFAAGNYRIQINNTVVNPIRTFFGLPPTYLYKGPATVEVEDVGALRGPTVPSNPDPWIKEIAGLMSDFYELLFKMRYWSEDSRPIDYPPHAPQYCINTEITSKYRLERQVVHLLQLLPYIRRDVGHNWEDGAGDHEFLLYGAFADFRDDDDLEQSRDPLFASVDPLDASVGWDDEDGQYMRPYYTPLNQLGNHGVVLILDTRSRHLWVIDQEGGQADPGIQRDRSRETKNRNSLDQYASRPATDVLRDLMQRFIDLEWIPGGIFNGSQIYDTYKRLYLEHGWPDKFDGPGFDVARREHEDRERQQFFAEEPYRTLERVQQWLKLRDECDAACKLRRLEADAANPQWRNTFADPNGWKIVYEDQKKSLLREQATEAETRELMLKQIEVAKKEIEALPEEVKKRREERIRKYGS